MCSSRKLIGLMTLVQTLAALLVAVIPAYAVGISDTLMVFKPDTTIFTFSAPDDPSLEGAGNYFGPASIPSSVLNVDPFTGARPDPTIIYDLDGTISDLIGICFNCISGLQIGWELAFLSNGDVPLTLTSFEGQTPAYFYSGEGVARVVSQYFLPGSGWQATFTSFEHVDAPVPLPATLPLFASGLAGLGWLSRRRRKQATA